MVHSEPQSGQNLSCHSGAHHLDFSKGDRSRAEQDHNPAADANATSLLESRDKDKGDEE